MKCTYNWWLPDLSHVFQMLESMGDVVVAPDVMVTILRSEVRSGQVTLGRSQYQITKKIRNFRSRFLF